MASEVVRYDDPRILQFLIEQTTNHDYGIIQQYEDDEAMVRILQDFFYGNGGMLRIREVARRCNACFEFIKDRSIYVALRNVVMARNSCDDFVEFISSNEDYLTKTSSLNEDQKTYQEFLRDYFPFTGYNVITARNIHLVLEMKILQDVKAYLAFIYRLVVACSISKVPILERLRDAWWVNSFINQEREARTRG